MFTLHAKFGDRSFSRGLYSTIVRARGKDGGSAELLESAFIWLGS